MFIYRWKCEAIDSAIEGDNIVHGIVVAENYYDAMNRVFRYMANNKEENILNISLENYCTDIIAMPEELMNKVDDEVIW